MLTVISTMVSSSAPYTVDPSPVVLRPLNSVRGNLRSLLYSVAEDLNSEDLNRLLFLTSNIINSKHEKERIKSTGSPLNLFEVLLERDAINDENISVLFDLLSKIRRFDVMKKAKRKWAQLKGHFYPGAHNTLEPQLLLLSPTIGHIHDGLGSSSHQNVPRSLRGQNSDGIVQRKRQQFERISRSTDRDLQTEYRFSVRPKYPPARDIDWDDEEVKELLSEPFRQRTTPISRNHTALSCANIWFTHKALRDILTQSIADGSYYCPMHDASQVILTELLEDDDEIREGFVNKDLSHRREEASSSICHDHDSNNFTASLSGKKDRGLPEVTCSKNAAIDTEGAVLSPCRRASSKKQKHQHDVTDIVEDTTTEPERAPSVSNDSDSESSKCAGENAEDHGLPKKNSNTNAAIDIEGAVLSPCRRASSKKRNHLNKSNVTDTTTAPEKAPPVSNDSDSESPKCAGENAENHDLPKETSNTNAAIDIEGAVLSPCCRVPSKKRKHLNKSNVTDTVEDIATAPEKAPSVSITDSDLESLKCAAMSEC